ncbi:MAG: hypothetical protein SFU83_12930 [Meiothermus sp.]|nr:hypothetical protein [Meiothermus sp.]
MGDKKRQKKLDELTRQGDQFLLTLVAELERLKKLTAEAAGNGRGVAQQIKGLAELRRSAKGFADAAKGLQKRLEKREKLEATAAPKPIKPKKAPAPKAAKPPTPAAAKALTRAKASSRRKA